MAGLVPDPRSDELYERRRRDCAHLAQCELAWIREHGNKQGKCPAGCRSYARAEDQTPIPSDHAGGRLFFHR